MAEAVLQTPEDYDYPTPDHIIIWLDAHIGQPGEYKTLKNAFTSNIDPRNQTWTMITDRDIDNLLRSGEARPVLFAEIPFLLLAFDDVNRCYESIERNRDKHIYFITSGTLGEAIIPRLVENHEHLFKDPITKKSYCSIYIFCGYTPHHVDWMLGFLDHVLTFNHEADLLARMIRDVANNFVEQGEWCLNEALRRYQSSKKVFTQYSNMGEICINQIRQVEQMTANIEKILKPHISNPHVDGNNANGTIPDPDNDDDRLREPSS